jgi:hypothetical protein
MWNIGRSLFPEESRGIATLIGALVFIASLSIAGAIVYYVAPVNAFSLSIAAILVILLTLIIAKNYTLHARILPARHGSLAYLFPSPLQRSLLLPGGAQSSQIQSPMRCVHLGTSFPRSRLSRR